jgi:beta-glucanase (GH16 family)
MLFAALGGLIGIVVATLVARDLQPGDNPTEAVAGLPADAKAEQRLDGTQRSETVEGSAATGAPSTEPGALDASADVNRSPEATTVTTSGDSAEDASAAAASGPASGGSEAADGSTPFDPAPGTNQQGGAVAPSGRTPAAATPSLPASNAERGPEPSTQPTLLVERALAPPSLPAPDGPAPAGPTTESLPPPPTTVAPTQATTTSVTSPARPSTTAVRPTPPPATTAPPPPPSKRPPAGEVVWQDDFDRLDTSRWAVEHSTYGDGNNELQCYRPENVSVGGGRLTLRAVTETYTCPNGSTRQVTSGMVRSRGLRFEPGQAIEFRVKLTPADPNNQGGLWPAVWSSGWAGGGWPRGGEIDYLEVMTANDPKRSIYSIHYAKPDGSHGVTNRPIFGADNFSANWHTVRFEYGRSGDLTWILDGRQVNRVSAAQTVQGYPAPFDQAIGEIKINLALGGRPGPLDPRALGSGGATFEIDYIRVVRL